MSIAKQGKQRLRTLEKHIRKLSDSIHKNALEVARHLLEIKDGRLWEEEDYDSFEKYLTENCERLCGRSRAWSFELVNAGEVERKLAISPTDWTDLQATHYQELARLAPTEPKLVGKGKSKNFHKLKPDTLVWVLEQAAKIAEKERGDDAISVRDIRQVVDKKLKKKKAKEEAEEEDGIDLAEYIRQRTGTIQGMLANLAAVPVDGWKLLEDTHPLLAEEMAAACDELAELLRS